MQYYLKKPKKLDKINNSFNHNDNKIYYEKKLFKLSVSSDPVPDPVRDPVRDPLAKTRPMNLRVGGLRLGYLLRYSWRITVAPQ